MKKYRRTLSTLALLMLLNGCAAETQLIVTEPPITTATVSLKRLPAEENRLPPTEETIPVRESVEETETASVTQPITPTVTEPKHTENQPETQPAVPEETLPMETVPPITAPAETVPPETKPVETESLATEATGPEATEYSYAFKREAASYAAMYLNKYRGTPCTVLPGMSEVAQYRANQLTWNFAHSTADKRSALAYYGYGRWIDATLAGLEESDSYYESDTAEAICRYFHGDTAEELGKTIADMIRNSNAHWCYVGDVQYSYMGIGVEYRDGWYACVMVGTVNYG